MKQIPKHHLAHARVFLLILTSQGRERWKKSELEWKCCIDCSFYQHRALFHSFILLYTHRISQHINDNTKNSTEQSSSVDRCQHRWRRRGHTRHPGTTEIGHSSCACLHSDWQLPSNLEQYQGWTSTHHHFRISWSISRWTDSSSTTNCRDLHLLCQSWSTSVLDNSMVQDQNYSQPNQTHLWSSSSSCQTDRRKSHTD